MEFRLLVELDALIALDTLPNAARRRLLNHLILLRRFPERFSIARTCDETGRPIDVSAVDGYAIHYWIDSADRHIKIMKIDLDAR